MIAVIDYGAGNLMSVKNALDFLGIPSYEASSPRQLKDAEAIILPGVGEFGSAAGELEKRGLRGALTEEALSGKPLLGICLGMQLLLDSSEESPDARGLGLISGKSRRFAQKPGLKVPHMGWNSITPAKKSRILPETPSYMYFVHSYWAEASDPADASAECTYGNTFHAALEHGNIFGCQFHPEKSGRYGLNILKKFYEITKGAN